MLSSIKVATNGMKLQWRPRLCSEAFGMNIAKFHGNQTNLCPEMLPYTKKLVEGIQQCNRTALSRAITLVESALRRDEEQAELLLDVVLENRRMRSHQLHTANSEVGSKEYELPTFRVGIAGPPGAGKSTFIETLGLYLTGKGHKVAVLAIDPSSSRSGGSILGDKTRMTHLANDPNAYVRPSPSRGTLGGVAQHTNDIVLLCEATGYDIILVESVGLGQSEIVIDDTVDMVTLLVPPAAGDDLQGSKKGIMEIADMIIVNKADGPLKGPAKHAAADYKRALQLIRLKEPEWRAQVKLCSSLEKEGIDKAWQVMDDFRKTMSKAHKIAKKREAQSSKWMWNELNSLLMQSVARSPSVRNSSMKLKDELVKGFISPRHAAGTLVNVFVQSYAESESNCKD